MAYYANGILIGGANTLPKMTMAEYLALPVSERPTYWECTDKDYVDISAENVSYGGGTVEDALDGAKWTYLGQTTGNAEITIPAEAEEVICISGFSSTYMDFHFLTMMDDIISARKGFYLSGTNNDVFIFKWIKATRKANLVSYTFAGTDYTSNVTTKWYVKS